MGAYYGSARPHPPVMPHQLVRFIPATGNGIGTKETAKSHTAGTTGGYSLLSFILENGTTAEIYGPDPCAGPVRDTLRQRNL